MRVWSAILGTITVPVVYAIMRESGYHIAIAAVSSIFILFGMSSLIYTHNGAEALDNGHITQTRLILLDAPLVFFMALTILFYIKFHQQRYREFTYEWWGWLLATGTGLALTLGCKMVGLFTFMTVGAAVLWDLWEILDIKKGHDMVCRHQLADGQEICVETLLF